jgi:hypothetical protein
LHYFLITTRLILIEILINFGFIDGDGILSLNNDVKIKRLHVLLAHKMTVRNDDVCPLLEVFIEDAAILIITLDLRNQVLQLHTAYLSLPLCTPEDYEAE